MSNIYVTEPSTNGKVIMKTTVGEIEIELWSKETPLACRNFVQLCMEGYYDDAAFHRLIRGFIVQGGDPTGTRVGGESIYAKPFKTEIHSRLSFNRRGLVGMACLSENENGSQFFFTLGPATELTGKHTLFGRVVGETLFNMLRLGEGEVGSEEKPIRLHRIVNTHVVLNPYDDIVPRPSVKRNKATEQPKGNEVTARATKNFSLLSFGEEAEEEEHVTTSVAEQLRTKGKSAHDLLSDPRLSSIPVIVEADDAEFVRKAKQEAKHEAEERKRRRAEAALDEDPEAREAKLKRMQALKEEGEELRRQITLSRLAERKRNQQTEAERDRLAREAEEKEQAEIDALARYDAKKQAEEQGDKRDQPLVQEPEVFEAELANYRARAKKTKQQKERESNTMALLERFENRLRSTLKTSAPTTDNNDEVSTTLNTDTWMCTRLISDTPAPARQVLDPSMPHPDRYDLYDPRNPLNVRKRGGETMGGAEVVDTKFSRR